MLDIEIALDDLKIWQRKIETLFRQLTLTSDEEYFPKIKLLIAKRECEVNGVVAPKSLRPEYRLQWENYRQGKSTGLNKVAIKWLCWESDIVHDPKFADYLSRNVENANARVIKGLVWSLHQSWGQNLPKKEITEYTALQLSSYSRADRTLVKWKGDITTIIGENGPSNFAKKNLLKEKKSPKEASKEWAVNEFSEYVYEAVVYAVNESIEKISGYPVVIDYLFDTLFTWPGWESHRSNLHDTVTKLVFHPAVNQIKEQLKTSILKHPLLGDPRLPTNRNKWVGMDSSAVREFIIWLSAADINFFFDYVLKGQDRHGRRAFWLNYVHRLIGCRSLLSDMLASQLRGNKDISYGRLSETQNKAAFILDFGNIVAVEFSDAGKGCVYLFPRLEFDKSIPDMWAGYHISESRLKNQYLPREFRVPHHVNWEYKLGDILARNGIRP